MKIKKHLFFRLSSLTVWKERVWRMTIITSWHKALPSAWSVSVLVCSKTPFLSTTINGWKLTNTNSKIWKNNGLTCSTFLLQNKKQLNILKNWKRLSYLWFSSGLLRGWVVLRLKRYWILISKTSWIKNSFLFLSCQSIFIRQIEKAKIGQVVNSIVLKEESAKMIINSKLYLDQRVACMRIISWLSIFHSWHLAINMKTKSK